MKKKAELIRKIRTMKWPMLVRKNRMRKRTVLVRKIRTRRDQIRTKTKQRIRS
ncbi:hypothetical protein FWK35_00027765 [Aphis craccivora]|uniref:Uncharacterized protein n=1 Tax=Aphis craccivora TaxID=307492 RepID=A0A6G0YNS0_APHCR|nr:hypothetical protein FWK35_00027765 [Aphis craccivora]